MLLVGDILFTSRSVPIWLWQLCKRVPYPHITHSAIYLGDGVLFESLAVKGKGASHLTSGDLESDYCALHEWYEKNCKKKRKFHVLRPAVTSQFDQLKNSTQYWYGESYGFLNGVLLGNNLPGASICSVSVAKCLTHSKIEDFTVLLQSGSLYPGTLYSELLHRGYVEQSDISTSSYEEFHKAGFDVTHFYRFEAELNRNKNINAVDDLVREIRLITKYSIVSLTLLFLKNGTDPICVLSKVLNDIIGIKWKLNNIWECHTHISPKKKTKQVNSERQALKLELDACIKNLDMIESIPSFLSGKSREDESDRGDYRFLAIGVLITDECTEFTKTHIGLILMLVSIRLLFGDFYELKQRLRTERDFICDDSEIPESFYTSIVDIDPVQKVHEFIKELKLTIGRIEQLILMQDSEFTSSIVDEIVEEKMRLIQIMGLKNSETAEERSQIVKDHKNRIESIFLNYDRALI